MSEAPNISGKRPLDVPGGSNLNPDCDPEGFGRALQAGALRIQRCSSCGMLRFPTRAIGNRCFAFDAEWQRRSGRGLLVSWIRTHQVFAPRDREKLPYVVVQVRLEEQDDILMIGGWQGGLSGGVGSGPETGSSHDPVLARRRGVVAQLDLRSV